MTDILPPQKSAVECRPSANAPELGFLRGQVERNQCTQQSHEQQEMLKRVIELREKQRSAMGEAARQKWPQDRKWQAVPEGERTIMISEYNKAYLDAQRAYMKEVGENASQEEHDDTKVMIQDSGFAALQVKLGTGQPLDEQDQATMRRIEESHAPALRAIMSIMAPRPEDIARYINPQGQWTNKDISFQEFHTFMESIRDPNNAQVVKDPKAEQEQKASSAAHIEQDSQNREAGIEKNGVGYFINLKAKEIKSPNFKFTQGEGFAEIVAFVNGTKSGLSPEGQKLLYDMTGGEQAQNKKFQKEMDAAFKRENGKKSKNWKIFWNDHDHEIYQLACAQIAQEALQKLPNKSDFLSQMEQRLGRNAKGHIVEHSGADNINSKNIPSSKRIGRADLLNAGIYEGVSTIALFSFLANVMVAIGSEDPLGTLAGNEMLWLSGAAVWGSYKGVLKSGLDEWRYPKDMSVHILRESGMLEKAQILASEAEYKFLQDGIQWSEKASSNDPVRKALKSIKEKHGKAKTEKESLSIADLQSEEMQNVLTPAGKEMLKTLPSQQTGNTAEMDKKRYEMVDEIASRRGNSNDLLPRLHTLHKYAKEYYTPIPQVIPIQHVNTPSSIR